METLADEDLTSDIHVPAVAIEPLINTPMLLTCMYCTLIVVLSAISRGCFASETYRVHVHVSCNVACSMILKALSVLLENACFIGIVS